MNIASYIDHTVLKPTTTSADIEKLCAEAVEYGFAAVCVPPYFIKLAKKLVAGSVVKVATVIGFPFGYSSTAAKLAEVKDALEDGADELDVVHNLAALKNGDWSYLDGEMYRLVEPIKEAGKAIKVIVESGLLTDEELIKCCEIYSPYGIDFMKTSTGYAEKGATLHAVQMMRRHLPESIAIKASGGIRTFDFARELVEAGADRLGCSASVAIAEEANAAS